MAAADRNLGSHIYFVDAFDINLVKYSDKIAHVVVYAMLSLAFLFALSDKKYISWRSRVFYTLIFCLVYGVSDEFHQSFIIGRYTSFTDLVADGAGALAGIAAWTMLGKIRSL